MQTEIDSVSFALVAGCTGVSTLYFVAMPPAISIGIPVASRTASCAVTSARGYTDRGLFSRECSDDGEQAFEFCLLGSIGLGEGFVGCD